MNAFAKIDPDTFFRFAAAHPEHRYELERGRIVQQMTGGTLGHGLVARRILRQIENQIDANRWLILQERGVKIGSSARYPDVVVEPVGESGDSLSTTCPAIIVEVLSPSTTATDLNTKPGEYLAITTLGAYIVASQDEAAMLVWLRDKNGIFPAAGVEVEGTGQTITVNGRGSNFTLKLDDIYEGIA